MTFLDLLRDAVTAISFCERKKHTCLFPLNQVTGQHSNNQKKTKTQETKPSEILSRLAGDGNVTQDTPTDAYIFLTEYKTSRFEPHNAASRSTGTSTFRQVSSYLPGKKCTRLTATANCCQLQLQLRMEYM